MNAKLIFKTLFLIVIALIRDCGTAQQGFGRSHLPPLLPKTLIQPAAIMYIGFFDSASQRHRAHGGRQEGRRRQRGRQQEQERINFSPVGARLP